MDKEKIKSIIGFLFFIAILLFLFTKVTWLFRGNDVEARTGLVAFKNQENVDVVLYGGSTLLRYFSPLDAWNKEGMVAYNYATSSAKVDIVKEYIEDSRKTNEAKLYVIDIRTYPMLTEVIDDPSLRNWSDSLPIFSFTRWEGISHFLFTRDWKETDVPSFYFDIIKYHSNKAALSDPNQWKFLNKSGISNTNRGFAPNIALTIFDEPEVIEDRGELTAQQANALNDLLDYCDKEQLPVLFIVCPYYISEDDWRVLNTCEDIIKDRGYDFVNFNNYYDEIGLDFQRDFSDVNHVNYIGSIKYTEYLLNYIKTNYDIPDRRGEDLYNQLNDDYIQLQVKEKEWYEILLNVADSQISAHENGQKMRTIDSFDSWYELAQNDNYTMIISMRDGYYATTNDALYHKFIFAHSMNDCTNYTGVWKGGNCIFMSTEMESTDLSIGVNGNRGRGQDNCVIAAGRVQIAGVDYTLDKALLQIIIYDNNYKEVIDNVSIVCDDNGEIRLER